MNSGKKNAEDQAPGTFDFETVRARELEAIAKRRATTLGDGELGLPDDLLEALEHPSQHLADAIEELRASPDEGDGLIGLALSGGGIRSSTFNLGVLQAVHRVGLFRFVDYLSTVSGGGYIGTYLTTSMLEDDADAAAPEGFPFVHETGVVEDRRFRHLRNHASFLAPGGKAELLEAPMLLLRGLVINTIALLPWLLGAALLLGGLLRMEEDLFHLAHTRSIDTLLAALGAWLTETTGLPISFGGSDGTPFAFPVSAAVAVLLVLSFACFPFVHARITARLRPNRAESRHLRARTAAGLRLGLVVLVAALLFEAQPFVLNWVEDLVTWFATLGGGYAGLAVLSDKYLARVKRLWAVLGVSLVGVLGLAVTWLAVLVMARQVATGAWNWGAVAIAFAVLAVYSARYVDINASSIHKYYRDHLVRAFVAQIWGTDDKRDHGEAPRLSELVSPRAPYHLLNAAVNVDRDDEEFKSGRRSSFFFFSRLYCGGVRTGYVETDSYEQVCPELDIGTAMAISGAAAAPNMGKFTNPLLSFTLALLNVRLNYWIRNPRTVLAGSRARLSNLGGMQRGVGPLYLLREMLNRLDTDEDYVNLSDGGHIENLGIYELMRRRCRLILVGDGEADPELGFEGLTEAIRLARIDFGIRVDMVGLDALRAGDQRFAIGTIDYGDGRIGKLIYMKSNLGGDYNLQATLDPEFYRTSADRNDDYLFDNDAWVAHYRHGHPSFPHETTADQFFDEAQFEAYRALGVQVATSALIAPTR